MSPQISLKPPQAASGAAPDHVGLRSQVFPATAPLPARRCSTNVCWHTRVCVRCLPGCSPGSSRQTRPGPPLSPPCMRPPCFSIESMPSFLFSAWIFFGPSPEISSILIQAGRNRGLQFVVVFQFSRPDQLRDFLLERLADALDFTQPFFSATSFASGSLKPSSVRAAFA